MKRSRTLISTVLVVMMFAGGLFANGLSLNSIGTRAMSMGGAFVGLSNDLTAIYWNPAGLTQGEGFRFEVFASDIIPIGSYKWSNQLLGVNINADMNQNHYISPNLFAAYNTGSWSFGLGLYVPAGLGTEWNGKDLVQLSNGVPQDWMSKIGVFNISPSVAYKVSDRFSIGVAGNIYYGTFDMDRAANIDALHTSVQYEESSDGIGYGVSIGALIKLHERVNFGFTWRTKTTLTMSGTAKNPAFAALGAPESDFDRDVAWPMWIAGGIAFKPSDELTITVDAQFSQWAESSDKFVTRYDNQIWKAALEAGGNNIIDLNWDNATQWRIGAEYYLTDKLALRGGYYYDPAPAPDETVNILFPSSTNDVATLGLGYNAETFFVNVGFEYLFGQDRKISDDFVDITNPALGLKNDMPGIHSLDVFAFSLGFGMSF